MIDININYSFHFLERVKERMGMSVHDFNNFWKYNTKIKIFHGKYENRDKRVMTHYLTKYEGKYFIIIREKTNFVTVLTEVYYRKQSWAVPLSPNIEKLEEYLSQRDNQKEFR